MRRVIWGASLTVLTFTPAFCQSAAAPAFEVATIKPSAPPSGGLFRIARREDPGRIDYTYVSLKDCIRLAYRVKENQVSGPDWLASQRFDIAAKFPAGATRDQLPEMMQALLAERFKLAVHREQKEMPVYALVVAKNGPKLKPSETPVAPPSDRPAGPGGVMKGNMNVKMMGRGRLEANQMSMSSFTDILSQLVDRPVVDMTELKGVYDFKLDYTPDEGHMQKMAMMAGVAPGALHDRPTDGGSSESSGPSIFTAVQEQLGLKLEGRKSMVDLVVVDRMEKTPSEN